MTREEAAIKSCEDRIKHLESAPPHHYGKRQRERAIELEKVKINALRPIGREQVEKAEWIWSTGDVYTCSSCGEKTNVDECMGNPIYNFCPFCMAPMTDEAVEMVIERWEALNDGKGD